MEPKQQGPHFHGSDLGQIERVYGIPADRITSFSANVNPLGISSLLRENLAARIDVISSYPDRDYTSLREAIASYAQTDPARIIVGNGSTELISLTIHAAEPKHALILGPTYSEYERAVTLAGGDVRYFPLREEDSFRLNPDELIASLTEETDLLILCNPNNPTSSHIPQSDMHRILRACKSLGILVLVDETYVEFDPDLACVTAVPLTGTYDNLVVLRGVSKFFAAPGLRLGYAVCGSPALTDRISRLKDPWSVSSLASAAGEIMFGDRDYIARTRTLIGSERTRVTEVLNTWTRARAYPAAANFVLVRILRPDLAAADLFDAAIRKGLMIRDCSTFPCLGPEYFRFCFMMPEKNDELLAVLAPYLS